jgi:hypothetical protein
MMNSECCDKWWSELKDTDKMYVHLLIDKVMSNKMFKKMIAAGKTDTPEAIRKQHDSAFRA